METYLMNKDPDPLADHWQVMYRGGFYRGGPILMSAIAGIDQALWDLRGKAFDAPVHELLGGPVRDRVRVYQWIGGDRPSDVGRAAVEKHDQGFTALKMNATPEFQRIESPAAVEEAVARIREVRERVGDQVDIAVDFHGRVAKSMVKRLAKALEPYEPMFIEEPVLPQHNDVLPALANQISTPIATGERMFSRWDFRKVFEQNSVDVIQPDLSHAGGITEVKKIADMAEAYDVALAPHCPLGPIALASCIQVDAIAPNALIQETSLGIHYNEGEDVLDYLKDGSIFEYQDGFVGLPKGPGLGVTMDQQVIKDRAGDVDWHNPVWRHDDGSIAEW